MIDWKRKLEIITEGNATYELDEDERGDILKKISALKSRLDEVEELVSIVEWVTPHGHEELHEHIADVERHAECLIGFVEGLLYYHRKEKE